MLPDSFAFSTNSDCSSNQMRGILKLYVNKILNDANKYLSTRKISCDDRSMDEHKDSRPLQHWALDEILSADDVESVTARKNFWKIMRPVACQVTSEPQRRTVIRTAQ